MPDYPKSQFAQNVTRRSGILELMDDLGEAMTTARGKMRMMGGGNPGHIPQMQALWRERMQEMLTEDGGAEFDGIMADYDQPAGSPAFREAMAGFLRETYGWNVTSKNIAITNGGQTAFFFLLNRFAGRFPDGSRKQILLPVVPEYIGYADQSVGATDLFSARRPLIEEIDERTFKYRIDFDNLDVSDEIGAIAVSRPTNPSSNVLTDNEIARLATIAKENNIPLLIDNAYGVPFPGVVFEPITPVWDEQIVLTLSLSKLGLPGTRTGIVVACEEVIEDISAMTAVIGLANTNVGQAIVRPIVESGEILTLANDVVRPFYAEKSAFAQSLLHEHLPADLPWRMHKSEGAFFLWLHFPDLPIPTKELYLRLKARNALVVPGEYFFFGLETADWKHSRECIRLSYTQSEQTLREGIAILGEELRSIYG